MNPTLIQRQFLMALAGLAWFSLLLQLWLSLQLATSNGKTIADGLLIYFGYFTVLTNLFVALLSTLSLRRHGSPLAQRLTTGTVWGSATTAILLVGLAYHFLLRQVWNPQGWQWLADMGLHYAIPLATLAYWGLFPPAGRLPWWAPLAWCSYPATYLLYAMARGAWLHSYPYPFIDVIQLGYSQVLINALGLLLAFLVLGYALRGLAIAVQRRTSQRDPHAA
jgi:hypothetical protein